MKDRTDRRGVKGREIDYREVVPPGQDSCQPGPDMTSAEGEAGRNSQWWGVSGAGIRGQFRGESPALLPMPGFGCFPPSLPGSCFFLCLLVMHHCVSASQNLGTVYLIGLSNSVK